MGGLIDGDDFFDGLLDRMRTGEAEAALELIAYVQEFHRLDHRIVRTRRATLGDETTIWPARELTEVSCVPAQAEAIFLGHLEELPLAQNAAGAALRALYQRFGSSSAASALHFLEQRAGALDDGPEGTIHDPICRIAADSGPNDEPIILTDLVRHLPPLADEVR